MTILEEILSNKALEVAERKARRPLQRVEAIARNNPPPRGFLRSLQDHMPAVIAECKKGSPSMGVIRKDYRPVEIALGYERAGAACVSVLTDAVYFHGSDAHLIAVRNATALPALRKDFVIEPYQVVEARALGADCVLLIVAALDDASLAECNDTAREVGIDVLVEVHDSDELDRALALSPALVGINNRNLKDRALATNLDTTIALAARVPDGVHLVTESGIKTREDIERMTDAGISSFLVGTSFMKAPDPGAALRRLFGRGPSAG